MTPAATQRKRVSQACDRCRSRKDKCDGVKPVCSTCAIGGHNCSYDPSIKKRGLPEGYVRGLEKLWGLTIREAPDVETTILSLLDQNDGIEQLSKAWSDKDCEETLLDTWRRSRLSKELDTLLPILEIADDKTLKRKRQESSIPSSAYDSAPLLPRSYTGDFAEARPTKNVASASEESKYEESSLTTSGLLDLPRNTWDLIDLYFSYTHCWLPILEKHNLLKAAHSYPTRMPLGVGTGDHASFWAVLAYSQSQQNGLLSNWGRSNEHQRQTGPWHPGPFYSTARKLIPDEDGEFELGHVQALILLALLNMGQDRYKQAWLLCGSAVRVAIELGLASGDAGNPGRRVYLGCFILDTLISARLQREPNLRTQAVLKHGLLQEDGSDEWDPWVDHTAGRQQPMSTNSSRIPGKTLSSFNLLVELVGLLNTAMLDHCAKTEGFASYRPVLAGLATTTNFSDMPTSLPPQLYHNELLFLCIASLVGLQESSEAATRLTVSQLLRRWKERFGLGTIPPTLDCFASLYLRRFFHDDNRTQDASLPKLEEQLTEVSKTWPTFNRSLIELRQALPLGFGPKYSASYEQARPSRPITSARRGFYEDVNQKGRSVSDGAFATPHNSSVYTPSGQSILEVATQCDPSLLATDTPNTQSSASPWGMSASPGLGSNMNVASQHSDVATNMQAQTFYQPSFPSSCEEDSVFNEFAALDTMKWTNNWDQSLQNLGFTDPENMNQDFQSFFKEPDPTYNTSNDFMSQLLGSSMDTGGQLAVGSFHAYPLPHYEAGQILQSLSTSDQQEIQNMDGG